MRIKGIGRTSHAYDKTISLFVFGYEYIIQGTYALGFLVIIKECAGGFNVC